MNTKTKIFLLFGGMLFLLLPSINFAQKDLKPIKDDATALMDELSNQQNKVERVSLNTENERGITVSVTFKGFEDKAYKVSAFVLNSAKKPIQEIGVFEAEMPRSKQLDISFALGDTGKEIAQTKIESKFLRIKVVPSSSAGGLGSLLEETIGDISLSPFDYLYELDKKWMLSGQHVIVNVRLTPYKNAASISQN